MECTSEAVEHTEAEEKDSVEQGDLDKLNSEHSSETRESVGHTWDKDMKALEKSSLFDYHYTINSNPKWKCHLIKELT